MQITSLRIHNFKSIRNLELCDIENSLILVGKNNTGKTGILEAVRAVFGTYRVTEADFNEKGQNIEIEMKLAFSSEDLALLHKRGIVSQYKRYDSWFREFQNHLPSFHNGVLTFTCIFNRNGEIRYNDGIKKQNRYIPEVLPRLYFIDTSRNLAPFQEDLLLFQEDEQLIRLRSNLCMFDPAKTCNQCFSCIGLINQKQPTDLDLNETAKLLEYKMYQLNLHDFSRRVNENYVKNGGLEEIQYTLSCNTDSLFHVTAEAWHDELKRLSPVEALGNGMKSIYMLSLLETYIEDEKQISSIIIVEYPELFLHPSLQKAACEILYRLSKKNQVFFTTHAPTMIANFTSRQIRQVVRDEEGYSMIRPQTDIDAVLDDLGYSANDFLNANFVFIVEGKQDKSRLPLLLNHYYSDIHDRDGRLYRISIITTNSCTNIRTYANLKYINQVYLQDQFLMIRDGDGKNAEELAEQLCQYYEERNLSDIDKLPRVRRRNVLILKYYSFENYFLNPSVMVQLGIVKDEETFYQILFEKWNEYLHRIVSGKRLKVILGRDFTSPEDIRDHMELVKIHMRGHNLYDIFYGPFKKQEREILQKYIQIAPRDDFKDILDAIEAFPFFESRKHEG